MGEPLPRLSPSATRCLASPHATSPLGFATEAVHAIRRSARQLYRLAAERELSPQLASLVKLLLIWLARRLEPPGRTTSLLRRHASIHAHHGTKHV